MFDSLVVPLKDLFLWKLCLFLKQDRQFFNMYGHCNINYLYFIFCNYVFSFPIQLCAAIFFYVWSSGRTWIVVIWLCLTLLRVIPNNFITEDSLAYVVWILHKIDKRGWKGKKEEHLQCRIRAVYSREFFAYI